MLDKLGCVRQQLTSGFAQAGATEVQSAVVHLPGISHMATDPTGCSRQRIRLVFKTSSVAGRTEF
jgi:hypothetical protein